MVLKPAVVTVLLDRKKDVQPWTSQIYSRQSKMLSSKKFACTGTLRQEFIRVYCLEIQSVMLVFSIQLCELLPLSPALWINSPPLTCVNVYVSILYTRIQCVRGLVLGLRHVNTCRKVPLQKKIFR
jgi:hypothetical protein